MHNAAWAKMQGLPVFYNLKALYAFMQENKKTAVDVDANVEGFDDVFREHDEWRIRATIGIQDDVATICKKLDIGKCFSPTSVTFVVLT